MEKKAKQSKEGTKRAESKPKERKPRDWHALLVDIGIPGLAVSCGLGLTGYFNFWIGLSLASVGFLLIAAVLWRSNSGKHIAVRCALAAMPVLMIGGLLWYTLVPAPLEVLMAIPNGTYKDGTEVSGIRWKPEFSPLNVMVQNETGLDYRDVDILVRTNLKIAAAGIANGLNHCVASATLPQLQFAYPEISYRDKDGKMIAIPLDQLTSSYFRVQCDRIAARSRVEITFAIVGVDRSHMLEHRKAPAWSALYAEYNAVGRPRKRYVPTCFVESCADYLPSTYEQFLK